MARRTARNRRRNVVDQPTPPPETAEDRQFRVERDTRENQESAAPPDEKVQLVSFTCVEAYTPSTIGNLIEGVERLGWVHDESYNPPFVNLIDWIQASRSSPYGGDWANLAHVLDVEGDPQPGSPLRAPLPHGVQGLWPRLISVTPSVTCLVIQFVLNEEESLSVDRVIRPPLDTAVERTEHGWLYVGPTQQKAELVVAERRRIRRLCESWIASQLAGTFAGGLSIHGMPTIEVFVCDLAKPFEDDPKAGHSDYRWVLNINSDVHAYESPSFPGWRLAAWDSRVRSDPFVLRLAARWSDVIEGLDPYGGASVGGVAARLTESLFPFATRFAIHCLLSGYEEHLADMRDRAARLSVRRRRISNANVGEIHDLITETGYDARVVASEVSDLSRDAQRYSYVADFAAVATWRREHGEESLVERLRLSASTRSANVVATEARARETAATAASLLASRINLRLGRAVVLLTWVLLGVAFLTLLATLLNAVGGS